MINVLLLAYSDLPAFLVNEGGLNSGFMIAHCTSAALGKPCSYNLNMITFSFTQWLLNADV